MSADRSAVILVDLDALLDTRIATLAAFNPTLATKLASSDDYWMRSRDDYSGLGGPNLDKFRELYDKRDNDVVENSMMTTIPYMVKDLINKLEQEFEITPRVSKVGLHINVWPYTIDDENSKALVSAMMIYGGLNTIPLIVSIPHSKLTMEVIKANYAGLIMYDFREWLKIHIESLRSMYLHDVMFIAPELSYGDKPDKQELRAMELRDDVNEFELQVSVLREYFILDYYPPALFSLHRPELVDRMFADSVKLTGGGEPPKK